MPDEFELFLSEVLSPPGREPDRAFVSRVQARIRLEEHLRAQRRSMLSTLTTQVAGLIAAAAAALWLTRSPAIASLAAESPAILLSALLAAFSFLILLFGSQAWLRRSQTMLSKA